MPDYRLLLFEVTKDFEKEREEDREKAKRAIEDIRKKILIL